VTATVLRIDRAQDSCVPVCTVVDHEAVRLNRYSPANPGPPACAPGRIRTCATASGGRVKARWLRWLTRDATASLGAMRWLRWVALVVYGSGVYPLCTRQDQQSWICPSKADREVATCVVAEARAGDRRRGFSAPGPCTRSPAAGDRATRHRQNAAEASDHRPPAPCRGGPLGEGRSACTWHH